MKKIVLASVAMGGAALVAFGASGTFAAFSDQATLSNEAGAGTLLLDASSPSTTLRPDAISLAPGESASYAYFLQNDGDTPGNLFGDLVLQVDNENGCYAPEGRAGDNCGPGQNDGELPDLAVLTARSVSGVTDPAQCTITSPGTPFLTPTPFSAVVDLPKYKFTSAPLAGGEAFCFVLTVSLPNHTGPDATVNDNIVQSDRMQFDIVATLEQATS